MKIFLNNSWNRVWKGLEATGDEIAVYDELISRYSEPWRKYHTLRHLHECLTSFDSVAHLATRPAEVEAALWFHDAVYELHQPDNEGASAQLATTILSASGVASELCSRIAELIVLTKHNALPQAPDEQLLVDIDLAILGASPSRFAEYERQIREEYSFVPEDVFREKRGEILRSFVARAHLYSTPHFRGLLEQQARINLANSPKQNVSWCQNQSLQIYPRSGV